MFAADAIKEITGIDVADDFRNKYHDEKSAYALIKKVTGGSTVEDAAAYCAQKHGLQELKSPLFAQRGDLVVLKDGDNIIAGVVHLNGRHVAVAAEQGMKVKDVREILRAWRV
jgi:hypothetical protein